MPEHNNDGRFQFAESEYDKSVSKERAAKENDATLKERSRVQDNEYQKINKHSEGYCWGCHRIDQVISTLIYACVPCMDKKGLETVIRVVARKFKHELCDNCGKWKLDVFQINVSLCPKCMRKVTKIHKLYRKRGGQADSPYANKLKKVYGKGWAEVLQKGSARTLKI